MMIEPPSEVRNQFVTLAVELHPIMQAVGHLVARIETLDRVKDIYWSKAGLGDPLTRVWECLCDYVVSGLKVDRGGDPEEEFEFFITASLSEILYIYDEGVNYQINRDRFVQDVLPVFQDICDGYLIPCIRPVAADLRYKGYIITAIGGRFVEHVDRLLLTLYISEQLPDVYGNLPNTERTA